MPTNDGQSHNQPSHEASVKGGQNSHKSQAENSAEDESSSKKSGQGSSHNQPSHEASVKGGQHSHGSR